MKKAPIILLLFLYTVSYAMTPTEVMDAYKKSYLKEKAQNYSGAINALAPVFHVYPRGYTLNLRIGWLYYLKGNFVNSIHHYRNALSASKNSIEAMLGIILPLIARDKFEAAQEMAYRIIKLDYYNYYGNLRLCYLLRKMKKPGLAAKTARKMLAVYPTDTHFLCELALAYRSMGEDKKARTAFQSLVLLDPNNKTAKKYFAAGKKAGGSGG